MTVYARPGAADALMSYESRYDNFIGGEWVPPSGGEYFENPTPVTGQTFCEMARSTEADIDKALDAAHAAATAWGKTAAAERAVILNKIADRIEANLESIALAESWDNGKPIRETLNADLPLAVDHFRYFAGAIRAQEGSLCQIDDDTVAYHFHEPLGVVGQIIPWNFPILMATWKLAPALAAGNAVVLKPAEQTPASILYLMSLIGDLLPAGVLNVVNGFGVEAGKPLASSNRIAKIAFTGETTTGRLIMQYASPEPDPGHPGARRQEPQHLLLRRDGRRRRLPGQGAGGLHDVRPQPGRGVHLPVAQPDPGRHLRRVPGAGRDPHQGGAPGRSAGHRDHDRRAGLQRPAGEDLVLHRDRQETRAPAWSPAASAPNSAATSTAATTCSPRSSTGNNKMRIFQEEIFGPVVAVTSFKDYDDAIRIANDTLYGLGAGVWSRDGNTAYRAGRDIKAGRVWTNCYHVYPAHAAFGGYKQSGIGRENHKMMLDHYQQTKNLLVSYSNKAQGFF